MTSTTGNGRPDASSLGDDELRQQFVAISSIGVMAATYLGLLVWLADATRFRVQLLVCAALLAVFFACYRLKDRQAIVSAIYLLAPAGCLYVLIRQAGLAHFGYIAPLAAIAAFQISRSLGMGALLLNTLMLILALPSGQDLTMSLGVLWVAAGIEFASTSGRMTVLHWALSSQQRAHCLLDELRTEQGQLNQTNEALTETTRRLQRSNAELKVARHEAEVARSAKEQFVAHVSHELRTPLSLILGFTEMLYLHPETYDGAVWTRELENDIHEIYRASRHLQSLVNDVLDLSRIDAMRLPMYREMQSVAPVVYEVLSTMSKLFQQRGIALTISIEDCVSGCQVFIDTTRIRQVLINLLSNALRYTDAGAVTIHCCQVGDDLQISVADTGVGIPAGKLSEVFQEFGQADPDRRGRSGAGLGLALSKRFVELHGGRMWIESVVSSGTTVHFTLPLPGSPQTALTLNRTPSRAPVTEAPNPIAIVDADPHIADMIQRYLEDRPVIWTPDLESADRLVDSRRLGAVIVNHPPGTTPFTPLSSAGANLRKHNVPIVGCSIASPSWLSAAVGLQDCLSKPIAVADLERVLRKHNPQPLVALVVDDDPGFVSLMLRMLGKVAPACRLVPAHSAAQALRAVRSEGPDVVFLDLLMPDQSGFEFLEKLRHDQTMQETAVVAVTGSSYAEDALREKGTVFTLTQQRGIAAAALLEIMRATLDNVHADYTSVA